MSFLTDVAIEGFRGIKRLNISHMSQINLFVGKTTLVKHQF
jgi:AAA15 family ATPase/GTPase